MSGTSSSIRTKLWWNSHWMVLFQNCVRQSRSPTKMATTVQLCCYWKQLWSRWAITGSWEPLVFAMLGDIDLIFGIWVYNDELQIKFTFRSGSMIFGWVMALGLWNLAKYLVVTTLFHYDLRYWLDFWLECITISYRSTLNSFVILSLLLRELKKGETFVSLLNIHGGDIRHI